MTVVTINKERSGQYIGYSIIGHSGYGQRGTDIVCAGISMASQMALYALNDQLGVVEYVIDEDALLQVFIGLKKSTQNIQAVEAIMNSLLAASKAMEEQYGEFIKVVEQEVG